MPETLNVTYRGSRRLFYSARRDVYFNCIERVGHYFNMPENGCMLNKQGTHV